MRHELTTILLFLLFYCSNGLRDVYSLDGHAKNSSCEMGSCYPATGNLLIGREKMLSATSTCGLHGKERYCIVSHLEPKKCFTCDSRPGKENDPTLSHRIENIVYSKFPNTNMPSWWQSENGKENVSIRLDLEAEFHFTHLIMKFRTFRPRAMLIERSSDKGKTWKVYRYFAENCDEAFPHVPKPPQRLLTDVFCESRYSTAEPSNLGEVILRVISPSLQGAFRDPYSPQLQDLLKMTNLRINFTKLQTLGDDLVDNRDEIKEKYYYAVKEMTVRGSCWCYGHARSCIPVEGVEDRKDMVHGKCNCTHNTKGLNCEECADAYNDVPWAPAIGRQANACRACNCNNHSSKCKFNEDVFIKSGRVSGGVCSNCAHNTKGKNCEECTDYYYLDPAKDISEPDACTPCECNLGGSRDNGLCDPKTDIANGLEAGRCHCKSNVHGKYCDMCKPGFWNFDPNNPHGCEECSCDTRGTINGSSVCDVLHGSCNCKENVTGGNCNQCLPEHWGLSINSNGCEPCQCVVGGSLFRDCDVVTGDCKCLPNIVGRRCDKPNHGFFVPTPGLVYEAEYSHCSHGDCRTEIREPRREDQVTLWTGPGFMRVYDNTELEFQINNIKKTNQYDIIIRYEPVPGDYTTAEVVLIRPDIVNYNDTCANYRSQDDISAIDLPSDLLHIQGQTVCLEADKKYKIKITFRTEGNNQVDSPTASILIDSVLLVPAIESLPFFKDDHAGIMRKHEYDRLECKESLYSPWKSSFDPECSKYHYSVGVAVSNGAYECKCDPTGSISSLCNPEGGQCECKPNVVGRKCDSCAPGTYGFGPQGCKACDCHPVGACHNICNVSTGQCLCKNGTYGRTCGECEPGQWNFPHCQPCECNGHAHICNSFTGECINCQDSTTGHTCDRCKKGFYGDPKIGSGIQCKPCQCPNTIQSGHSFASTCTLDFNTQDVVCHCKEGYIGPRCDACDDNFYGSPDDPTGSCQPCMCNNNTDLSDTENCDRQTGDCLKCLYNTSGSHCEKCKSGFYGDALMKTCKDCDCNLLGTDINAGACDGISGQCPCLPNVEGRNCSQCKANFWKIGSGIGCESCNCDKKGSLSEYCNPYNGECKCRDGFGGRRCNRCKAHFFGDPNVECFPCQCDEKGSSNLKCNQDNGMCECKLGIGGNHCNRCDRGWFGTFPLCEKCGECFYNWDIIIDGLRNKTNDVIKSAGKIKQTGATGAYNTEFKDMTKKISSVKNILNSTKENSANLENLNKSISEFRTMLEGSVNQLNSHSEKVRHVLGSVSDANYTLKTVVYQKVIELKDTAKQLNDNATQLQEKDLKGALNLTRAAGNTSYEVDTIEGNTKKLLHEVDRNCRRTEKFLNLENDTFSDTEQKNERQREDLEFQLDLLENQIPDLNHKICDGTTNFTEHCDKFCGGAGCPRCGGISCKFGAVRKAEAGLEFAKDTEKNINKHIKDAEKTFVMIEKARIETENANKASKSAHNEAFHIKSDYESLVSKISSVASEIEEHLKTKVADPLDIQKVVAEVMNTSIPYEPDKIRNLTKHINDKIASLKNINKIVDETKDDQAKANDYKRKAEMKMSDAKEVENKAEKLVSGVKATQGAQENVTNILQLANQSIEVIKKDLAQISSEISDAEQKANDTLLEVSQLQSRLKKLQTGVLKNEHDANSASDAGKRVSDQIKIANSKADELIIRYNKVNIDLRNKTNIYDKSKSRAQQLFDKAQMLSGSAKTKLKELKDFTSVFEDQEKQLAEFSRDIKNLLQKMMDSTNFINNKTAKYRNCNN